MQGGFEVKVLECYQPRGIAKLAFFVLCLGMIPFCGHLVMKDEETSGYIVYALFFIIPILLGILAIFYQERRNAHAQYRDRCIQRKKHRVRNEAGRRNRVHSI